MQNNMNTKLSLVTITLSLLLSQNVWAESTEELAKKLSNPIASLISVPLQYNYNSDIGANDAGSKHALNIQPVIPFSLNDEWNLISRTIIPFISQSDVFPGLGDQSGMGDITQSIFFSPKAPTQSGWIWGAGPIFLLPTATDELLGADKWGAGVNVVALKQEGQITYGGLANHIWSVEGDGPNDISNTFLQPFLSYTTKDAITYGLNTESTYNWKTEEWTVPVNATVTKVTKIGDQLISVGGGVRYWASSPDGSPEGWGIRLLLTFLFPK